MPHLSQLQTPYTQWAMEPLQAVDLRNVEARPLSKTQDSVCLQTTISPSRGSHPRVRLGRQKTPGNSMVQRPCRNHLKAEDGEPSCWTDQEELLLCLRRSCLEGRTRRSHGASLCKRLLYHCCDHMECCYNRPR